MCVRRNQRLLPPFAAVMMTTTYVMTTGHAITTALLHTRDDASTCDYDRIIDDANARGARKCDYPEAKNQIFAF